MDDDAAQPLPGARAPAGRLHRGMARPRRSRTVTRLAAALLGLLSLGPLGCRSSGDGTTIRFWAFGHEGEVVEALVPDFERAHPGIHVVVQQVPFTAAHEKLLTAVVGQT